MGIVRRMVLNPVAANMLMILIIGGGLAASFFIPRELFPEFSVDAITVTVPYPGASPADVEKGIALKLEDRLSGLEGIKEVSANCSEGLAMVILELYTDADSRKVLDEVKSEVDKIEFPDDAEDPTTVEVTLRQHVIHVAVAADLEVARSMSPQALERTLKEQAEEIREEINDLPEVSQVSISGVRDYEITIEVTEEALRRHHLSLAQVAFAVRNSSFDLPAGSVRTRHGEMSIRVVGQKDKADEYRRIVVLSKPDGTIVRLEDLATVREGFADVDVGGQFNGKPAALVSVFKTSDEDSIEIANAVRKYVAEKNLKMQAQAPGLTLDIWSDTSKVINDRLDMLVRNGSQGLLLVFLILWLFLGVRLSFWVALGIPVSLLGAVLVLHLSGMTLNMMSMFALIMALGLIVDDAIVVGENVYSQVEAGAAPLPAAIDGTRSVLMPVVAAVTTTWAAFVPLLFIPGIMGRFISALPIVIILALAFSLLECILILPPHLGHSLRRIDRHKAHAGRLTAAMAGVRRRLDAAIRWMINGPFVWLYRKATGYRYVTVAVAVGVMLVTLKAFQGGHIPFVGFPKVDSDTIRARITLPTGTAFVRTSEVARQISEGALALNGQYADENGQPIVQRVYALLGQHSGEGGPPSWGTHLCEVIVELQPSEERRIHVSGERLIQQWRDNTGPLPDALSQEFGSMHGGPGGAAIEIRLLGPDTDYVQAPVDELKDRLAGFDGVRDIRDDALPGKMEMKIRSKPGAENIGVDLRTLAGPVRDAFYGNESLTVQRGRDEVKVMIRYPESERRSAGDLENMRVMTPGGQVPFSEVADVEMSRGYTTLRRASRSSVITISADIDEDVANAESILTQLQQSGGYFDQLKARYPQLKIDLRGQREQIFESLNALYIWFPLALLCIYTILAALFRSYIQPLIIMVAIPFGLVGGIVGHWILGYDVTLLSMFGLVALAGVVVNDSLVLIDQINRNVRGGGDVFPAAEDAARNRFRPIILTTVTTVAGIGPLLLEQSFQAQFLKPMAVSIAFGLMFATLLTLLVVPSLYLIGNDLRRVGRWLLRGQWVAPEGVAKREMKLDA